MSLQLHYVPHRLFFKFDARTSRGAISEHRVFYLVLKDAQNPAVTGIGECAPLAGLSIDACPDLEPKLQEVCRLINEKNSTLADGDAVWQLSELGLEQWPAIRFALETALLDLKAGGTKQLYNNGFSRGECSIPINGLVWMGDKAFMQEQIGQKLAAGYTCLKLKIGSLDFKAELDMLQGIREMAAADKLTIRVDANGAFKPEEAFRKLERLARYELHSIEQPIKQGQVAEMKQLCAYTPIPIALDEELIGVQERAEQQALLEQIKPQYIILKPTLVGGLQESASWIQQAEERGIGWWMTSALESNIGLNAISQFTANYATTLPQGLGTGQLYHNNIHSPLEIEAGKLFYNNTIKWDNALWKD